MPIHHKVGWLYPNACTHTGVDSRDFRKPLLIGARIRVLWRILQSVRKEVVEEKTKKKPLTLAASISEMAERFSSNLECGLPYLAGTSVETLVSIG